MAWSGTTSLEIEDDRRNGYAWYVDSRGSLLEKEYPKMVEETALMKSVPPGVAGGFGFDGR